MIKEAFKIYGEEDSIKLRYQFFPALFIGSKLISMKAIILFWRY